MSILSIAAPFIEDPGFHVEFEGIIFNGSIYNYC